MKMNGLLAAAGLLVALGGAVWWSNKDEAANVGKPAKDAPPRILELGLDQFAEIRFERKGLEPTVVKRGKDNQWEITAPKQLAADQSVVGGVASALSVLNSEKLVEEKAADLVSFGLSQPSAVISIVKKDGKIVKVLLGDQTAIGEATYVKLDSDPRVFTMASKSSIDKDWRELRDKRLLHLNTEKLSRLELSSGKGLVEFGKSGNNAWTILKPNTFRADNFAVEELVRKLNDAKMEEVPEDAAVAATLAKFAAGALIAKASATGDAGKQEIEVRKDKEGTYFAKSSTVAGAYKVSSELGEALAKGLDDYRNKKLFDFAFQDPTRIELKGPEKAWLFEKSKNDWKSNGKAVQGEQVQAIADKLRELSSIKFPKAGGGAAHSEITVSLEDGKVTEKIIITKAGDTYYAMRAGESAVYEVDGKVVEDLLVGAAAVRDVAAKTDGKPDAKK